MFVRRIVRIVASVLAVFALALCFASCAKSGTSEIDRYVPRPEGKIRLQFYLSNGEKGKRHINNWLNEFNVRYPDVSVEVEYTSIDLDYSVAVKAKTVGDVINIGADNAAYFEEYLLRLDAWTPFYGIDPDEVIPSIYKAGTVEGKLYAVPYEFDRVALRYNRDAVKAAGLEDPVKLDAKGEWTWEVFKDYCQRLTREDENGRSVGCSLKLGQGTVYLPFMEGFGGQWYDQFGDQHIRFASDEKVVYGIEEMISLVESNVCRFDNAGISSRIKETESRKAFEDYDPETETVFLDTDFRGFASAGNSYESKGADWDVVSMPAFPVKRVGVNSLAFAAYSGTRNADAAAALCLSLFTEWGQRSFNGPESGLVPNLKALVEEDYWRLPFPDSKTDPVNGKNYDAFTSYPEADICGFEQCRIPTEAVDVIREYMLNLVPDVVNGSKDLHETLSKLEREANAAFEASNN